MTKVGGVRFKKHTDDKHPNSPITEHTSNTGHKYTWADVKVFVKEDSGFKRTVKEAIVIHVKKPAHNRNWGQKITTHPNSEIWDPLF